MKFNPRRLVFTLAAVINLLLVDQMVKAAAVSFLKAQPAREVIANFFHLAYVENRGCAWGLFQGQVWPLAGFACCALAFLIWKRHAIFPSGKFGALAEVLLQAGILGNLIDRLVRGCVIDMFDFHWGIHHFPCFNVADSYITIAATILIAFGIFVPSEDDRKPKKPDGKGVPHAGA